MQNISPIKQRILQYIDTYCSGKREFYTKTGISRGTLESKTGISEETFTKIFATYQNLSPIWVLLGKGLMILDENDLSIEEENNTANCSRCIDKDKSIKTLEKYISLLEEKVNDLKDRIKSIETKFDQTD